MVDAIDCSQRAELHAPETLLVLDWSRPLRHGSLYKAVLRPAVLRANLTRARRRCRDGRARGDGFTVESQGGQREPKPFTWTKNADEILEPELDISSSTPG